MVCTHDRPCGSVIIGAIVLISCARQAIFTVSELLMRVISMLPTSKASVKS